MTTVSDAPAPVTGPGRRRRRDAVGGALLRARVLVSSYAFVATILALRFDALAPRVVCAVLAVWGFVDAWWLTRTTARRGLRPLTVKDVRDAGREVTAYLTTYVFVLLVTPDPSAGDVAAYAVFAVVLVVVSLRSDLAHVNPTLYLLGRRVVTVTDDEDRERYLVCRRPPAVGERLLVAESLGVLQLSEARPGAADGA